MSHQVLARKWRPRSFDTLVGQEHVVRALDHALSTGHIHHAYLFTGTRGVGKTTIARILAKAVNCETGMTATPCGECAACTEIDQGRFVDYLELDAASNRGVDEMTQLLDNAVYAPTAGRFKVYMIDEVHMLTAHAFNAMLKTLEEPPPHVLFILATTDPQKVPVTVLSRCMQFNLRNMRAESIAGHLTGVLTAEQVNFEAGALNLIGKAAAGSMRDALSLLDQAIAYGGGEVKQGQVRDMLGTVDAEHLSRVFQALADDNTAALVAIADEVADQNAGADSLLAELARAVTDLAIGAGTNGETDSVASRWHGRFDAADLQVFYQILIHARRDLPLAPDVRSGLSMALLRLAAFSTLPGDEAGAAGPPAAPIAVQTTVAQSSAEKPAVAGPVAAAASPEPASQGPGQGSGHSAAAAARAALAGRGRGAARAEPNPRSGSADKSEPGDARRSSALHAALAATSRTPPPGFTPEVRQAAARPVTPVAAQQPASPPATQTAAKAASQAAPVAPAAGPVQAARPVVATPPDEPWDERWADEFESMAPDTPPGQVSTASPAASPNVSAPVSAPAGSDAAPLAEAASEPATPAPAVVETVTATRPPNQGGELPGFDGDWPALAVRMGLPGRLGQFMQQSELTDWQGHAIAVRVPISPLAEAGFVERVRLALAEFLGADGIELTATVGAVAGDTAAGRDRIAAEAALARACETIEADPFIKTLLEEFNGQIVPDSIRVADNPHEKGENRA